MRNGRLILGIMLLLIAVSLACSSIVPPTEDPGVFATGTAAAEQLIQTQAAMEATSTALAEALTQAAATPTPLPTNTAIPTATSTPGPLVIEDDFSQDVGRWTECKECVIAGGVLNMGPFPAVDSAEGYMAVCQDCGIVDEYTMAVDVTYLSGASDRGFGFLIWENDGYYIDLEVTTWQDYGMWFYDKEKGNGWDAWYYVLDKPYYRSGNLRPGRLSNRLEVEVSVSGGNKTVVIRINGKDAKSAELKNGPGRVGFVIGLHSLGVSFDNFYFKGKPVRIPTSSNPNG